MSFKQATSTRDIMGIAQKMLEVLGPQPALVGQLISAGLSPNLPECSLRDLLTESEYERLSDSVRCRLSDLLDKRLSTLRTRIQCQYRQLTGRLYSVEEVGLPDVDVEALVSRAVETRYHGCLNEIRGMLAGVLGRTPTIVDSRSPRGGFRDVSTPPKPQLTKQHNLLILETAFKHTTTPLSAEIDAISKLTSLEPHQVRPIPFIYTTHHCLHRLIHRSVLGYVFSFFSIPLAPPSFPSRPSLEECCGSRQ